MSWVAWVLRTVWRGFCRYAVKSRRTERVIKEFIIQDVYDSFASENVASMDYSTGLILIPLESSVSLLVMKVLLDF